MKTIFCTLSFLLFSIVSIAQVPQSFSYQSVIRDANWNPISNQDISLEVSIIEDSISGIPIYIERHNSTTSPIGLVNLAIGEGMVISGNFNSIDWGNHTYFVQLSVDISGGINYQVMGTNQLRSVPYALYAENAGSGSMGPQGLQGPQGPQGPQGNTGPAFFANMQGGKVDVGSEVGLGIKIISVTFPTPFLDVPNVICTASTQSGTIFDDSFNITVRSVTTTGFEMIVNRVDSYSWAQDLDAFWLAFDSH